MSDNQIQEPTLEEQKAELQRRIDDAQYQIDQFTTERIRENFAKLDRSQHQQWILDAIAERKIHETPEAKKLYIGKAALKHIVDFTEQLEALSTIVEE